MKITKRQLKRIIREEKQRLLEANGVVDAEMNADAGLRQLLDTYLEDILAQADPSYSRDMALEEAFGDIRKFIDGFENAVRYEEKNAEFKVR